MNNDLIANEIQVFAGEKSIVNKVDLAAATGRTLVIVGESGAGKSMLAKAITGLLPAGLRVEGNVQIAETNIDLAQGDKQLNKLRGNSIVWLPQDPFTSLSPTHKINKQILGPKRLSKKERQKAVAQRLTEVGLSEEVAHSYPHELSGGMRQRVAIAAALDSKPHILIADEPTTALDVTTQKEILDLLRNLRDSRKMALIIVTHDLGIARHYGDDILVMQGGNVVEAGRVLEVLDSPRDPYTQVLASSEPKLDGPAPRTPRQYDSFSKTDDLLSVANASKSFGNTTALENVSLSIHQNEAVGIVGESGSGKTTLARTIIGLENLDSGTIDLRVPPVSDSVISGKTRRSKREANLVSKRRAAQIVFQNPYSALNPTLKIGTVLKEALKAAGRDPNEAAELLLKVGLPVEYLEQYPARLSGGERQRVAIARAIAPRPNLLICDEAVSALDVSVQAQILDLLKTLQEELGLALLFITHDLAVVRQVTDRLIVMKNGCIVDEGSTEELLRNPTHPYTSSLLAAVPRGALKEGAHQ